MSEPGVPYIDRGEPLPMSYAENLVVAMIRDPEHVFAYWDVDTETRVAGRPIVLRVHCLSEGHSSDIETDPATMSWHLQVAANRTYRMEVYEREASGDLRLLATSDEVTTPVRWAGQSGDEPPAEILQSVRRPLARRVQPSAAEVQYSALIAAESSREGVVGEDSRVPIRVEEGLYTVNVRSGGL